MAKNFIQPGDVVDMFTASGVSAGDVIEAGSLCGVAVNDIAAAQSGPCGVTGVYTLPKATIDVLTQGAQLYWDSAAGAAGEVTETATGNPAIGVVAVPAGNGDTTVDVLLR